MKVYGTSVVHTCQLILLFVFTRTPKSLPQSIELNLYFTQNILLIREALPDTHLTAISVCDCMPSAFDEMNLMPLDSRCKQASKYECVSMGVCDANLKAYMFLCLCSREMP